ncbi:MAG: hypothetical protein AAB947_02015 [Patescibacteria group bacterium]
MRELRFTVPHEPKTPESPDKRELWRVMDDLRRVFDQFNLPQPSEKRETQCAEALRKIRTWEPYLGNIMDTDGGVMLSKIRLTLCDISDVNNADGASGNEASGFLLSFLERRLDTLTSVFEKECATMGQPGEETQNTEATLLQRNAVSVLRVCMPFAEKKLRDSGNEMPVRSITALAERMLQASHSHSYDSEVAMVNSSLVYGIVFQYGSETASRVASEKLLDSLYEARYELLGMILPIIDGTERSGLEGTAQERSREFIDSILSSTGMSSERIIQSWLENNRMEHKNIRDILDRYRFRQDVLTRDEVKLTKMFGTNMNAVQSLRRKHIDAPKILHDRFGIVEYGRYPLSILEKQFEEIDIQKPYGLILYPRNDYNQAFRDNSEYGAIGVFGEQISHLGIAVRVVEAGSKYDVARRLISLRNAYESGAGKIAFAIIGGHGTKDSIQLGATDKSDYQITTEDLFGAGVRRSGSFLKEGAPIVLVSCSTGSDKGIGQHLSEIFGTSVTAPTVPTMINTITPSVDGNGALAIDATYENVGEARSYASGQRDTEK